MDGEGVRTVEEGLAEGFGSWGQVGPAGVRVADRSGSQGLSFTGVVPERFKMAKGLFTMAECSFEMAGASFVKMAKNSFEMAGGSFVKMADGSFKMADGFFMVAGVSFKVAEGSFKVAMGFPIEIWWPVGFFVSYSFNIFSNPVQKVSKVFPSSRGTSFRPNAKRIVSS
jgi:hypothetical protein